jgi:hypothetical protein
LSIVFDLQDLYYFGAGRESSVIGDRLSTASRIATLFREGDLTRLPDSSAPDIAGQQGIRTIVQSLQGFMISDIKIVLDDRYNHNIGQLQFWATALTGEGRQH